MKEDGVRRDRRCGRVDLVVVPASRKAGKSASSASQRGSAGSHTNPFSIAGVCAWARVIFVDR
jgi:hypothetical protein